MSRLSIRARLTGAFAAAMVLVLVLAGLFTFLKVRHDLTEALEENLSSRADDVAALVASSDQSKLDLGHERLVDGEDSFSQVLAADGTVVASTLPPASGPAISADEAAEASADPLLREREVPGIDDEAMLLARSVSTPDGDFVVVVGATTQDRTEALAGLTGAFAIGAPVAILLSSLLGYLLAGRALAPVEAMRRRAAGITLAPDRQGERLPIPAADDEIRRLSETLNEMLDRIEESLERERVFVADASHELRTPLAILRTELELARRPGRSPDELRAAVASTAEEVDRLARLAEDLLVIARSDRGALPIRREKVDLDDLLRRVRGRFATQAATEGRKMDVVADPGARADLDPLRIEQAVANLVDNALRHGSGEVSVRALSEGDSVIIEVADDGPGFSDSFRELAFERLTRADDGRTGSGAGLGLAIVLAVARAHGGDASIAGGDGRAAVRMTLPVAPPES